MSRKPPAANTQRDSTDRRGFLKTALGIAAAAGLGLLGASLLRKASFAPSAENDSCTGDWICRDCTRVSACGYPEALSYRSSGRKG
jgi:hypothetical protein